MASDKVEILLIGAAKPVIVGGLEPFATVHRLTDAKDQDAFIKEVAPRIRGIAIAYTSNRIDGAPTVRNSRSGAIFRKMAPARRA